MIIDISNRKSKIIKILLFEDNPGDVRLTREMLSEDESSKFEMQSADTLSRGLAILKTGSYDVVLLDLGLPDSQGIETLKKVLAIAPDVPIVVLTGLIDEMVGASAVREGAQDYLVKGKIDRGLLIRSIDYAIERNLIKMKLKSSEARQNLIIEKNADAMIIIDTKGIIRFVNHRAEILFGQSRNKLLGSLFGYPVSPGKNTQIEIIQRGNKPIEAEIFTIDIDWEDEKAILASIRDITERKNAEETKSHLLNELKTIFDNIPLGIVYLDKDFKFLKANKFALSLMGFKEEDLIGRPCYETVGEYANNPARKGLEKVCSFCKKDECFRNKRPAIMERPLGNSLIRVMTIPELDKKGDVSRFIEIVEDITERKKAEGKLQETKNYLENLINYANAPIIVWDPGFRITRFNRAFERLTGYSADEVIGKELSMLFPEASKKESLGKIERTLTGEYWESVEIPILRKDGDIRIALWNSANIYAEDGKTLSATIAQGVDITERKESEDFIRNVFEGMGEGLVVIDREFRIISANKAYCKQSKAPSCDIIGRHCYEISHHRNRPCYEEGEECAVNKTFEDGNPHEVIHTHFDSEGTPVCVELKSFPMKNDEGRVVSVIETINDVTEKKSLEDQLRHAQKMEAIGTLAGGIAHDFNNILNAIIGFTSLIEMNIEKGTPMHDHVNEVFKAGERAIQLTQGLLAFSRKQPINPKPVDVNIIIKETVRFLTRVIGESIELNTKIEEKELVVIADYGQIQQVIMNLATNARDAMPDGGLLFISAERISKDEEFVRAHPYGKPGEYALITVSDTGFGMDEATKQKIFNPFFTTKEVGKGTGLGLAIVYGIIKQHEGYINVYSEPGKGTTFRIYLPLVVHPESRMPVKEEHEHLSLQKGSETILVAEDDPTLRKLSFTVLKQMGYTVIEAVDGEDAVSKFKEQSDIIKLVILDYIMPKKNGREAYNEIRKINPDIKSIFLSGYSPEVIEKHEHLTESAVYIFKPISPIELLRKIRRLLDR